MKKKVNIVYLILLVIINIVLIGINIFGGSTIENLYLLAINIMLISGMIFFFFARNDAFNPIAMFSITWLGFVGIAQFKLSNYQSTWSNKTWICIIGSFITFVCGYYWANIFVNKNSKLCIRSQFNKINVNRFYNIILWLLVAIVISLAIEVVVLGYIPILSDDPMAYKEFSFFYFHYVVVIAGIMPMLTLLYKACGGIRKIWVINFICIIISFLIVSRQLSILQFITSIIVYNYCYKKITLNKLLIFVCIGLIVFTFASSLRQLDQNFMHYASNFKEDKYHNIAQPYMYSTMGFDNVNNLVNTKIEYDNGKRLINSLELFTGIKFDVNSTEDYLVTPIFTAPTYLYTLYFDFGLIGTLIIPFIIGIIISILYAKIKRSTNNINMAVYTLLLYCIMFSFFVNWYYNTTMILYFLILFLIKILLSKKRIVLRWENK